MKSKSLRSSFLSKAFHCAIPLTLLAASPAVHAADGTWTGGTSVTWATTTNWSGGIVPGSNSANADIATFNSATYSFAPTAANSYFVGGLSFGSSNGGITITTGGGTSRLNVGSGGIQVASGSGAVVIGSVASHGINLVANQNWTNNSSNVLTLSRVSVDDVAAIGTYTVTINGSGTGGLTIVSNLADNNISSDPDRKLAAIINSANSTTSFNNGSTYSGGTTLTAGTLTINGSSAGTVGAVTSSSLGTGSVALNGGKLSSSNTAARIILNAVTIGGNVTLGDATNTGALTFSANTDLTGGTRTLTLAGNGPTFSGVISNGGLTTAGTGTLTLTGANSYTGVTTISSGVTLQLGTGATGLDGTLAGTSIVNNGALAYNRFGSASYDGVISGTGTLTKSGAGTQTLSGANTFSGITTISAGTLELTNALALQNSTLNSSSVTGDATNGLKITTSSLTLGGLSGNRTLASYFTTTSGGLSGLSALTLNPGSGVNNSLTAVLADGAAGMSVTKNGAGTQALTAANTYTGTTTLNAGTLQINSSSTGAVGAITDGSLGTGALVLNGGQLSTSGTTGRTLFNATTIGGNVTLGDAVNTGNLTFDAGINLNGGTRTLTAASTTSNIAFDSLVSNGGIIKEGPGTFKLNGSNTFAGGFTLNAGVVTISTNGLGSVGSITSSAFGTGLLTLNGGTVSSATATNRPILNAVTFGGNVGFGGGSGSGAGGVLFSADANLGGATRTLTTTVDTTFNGIVSNGGLTKDGSSTLILNAENTYSGTTTVSAGTLQLGSGGSITSSSAIRVASGATLDVSAVSGYTVGASASQTLGGSGGVTGAVTIGSLGTHNAGDAAVNAGVGSQAFSSTLTYGNGSIFNWDLNANSTASGFDTVSAGGAVTAGTTSIFNVVLGTTALAGITDNGNTFWNTPFNSQSWSMASIFGQAISGSFESVTTSTDVSAKGQFTITGSNLTWTAVPEPTSALAGILLGAGLLRRRRRA